MKGVIKNFKIKVEEETIASITISRNNEPNLPPKFIFLHGAGTGVKENAKYLVEPVLNSRWREIT